MTNTRVLLAGIAGGIGMFVWASIAHTVLPLGAIGVSQITENEPAVLASLHASLGNASGMYIYPSLGTSADAMKQYDAKLVSNPSGLLIYHPPGAKSLTPGQLITEFLAELIEALLAVWLLSKTQIATFGGRVLFVSVAGLLASLPTNLSYWNWYGFPGSYTLNYIAIQVIGFIVAAVVAAFVVSRSGSKANVPDTVTSSALPR